MPCSTKIYIKHKEGSIGVWQHSKYMYWISNSLVQDKLCVTNLWIFKTGKLFLFFVPLPLNSFLKRPWAGSLLKALW